MRRPLHRRYGRAKSSREELLRDALRDWRSGRAFVSNNGKRYMLRASSGGRAVTAPWNKVAREEWGASSEGLHRAAEAAYPRATDLTDFEKMHHMDPVATRLRREIEGGS
jgi:hypothetical protein